MLKVLASKALEFKHGGKVVRTKVGFCELPDWAEKDPYYEHAVSDGSIKAFQGNNPKTTEDLTKQYEEKAALEKEIEELKEKLDNMVQSGEEKKAAIKAEIAELIQQKKDLKGGQKE